MYVQVRLVFDAVSASLNSNTTKQALLTRAPQVPPPPPRICCAQTPLRMCFQVLLQSRSA